MACLTVLVYFGFVWVVLGLGFVTLSLSLRFVFLSPWMSCLDLFLFGLGLLLNNKNRWKKKKNLRPVEEKSQLNLLFLVFVTEDS